MKLTVDLKNYWHAGGGRGAGSVYDAIVHRDSDGLPVLPGRHLKGLLRDACIRAEAWRWKGFEPGTTASLFGQATEAASSRPPKPGSLRVSDAALPDDVARWLAAAGQDYLPHLFRGLYSTAVEHETGTAKEHSLRGMEVTVPLSLTAVIEPIPGKQPPKDWPQRIGSILSLIDAVGAYRSRGLGRVVLTVEEKA